MLFRPHPQTRPLGGERRGALPRRRQASWTLFGVHVAFVLDVKKVRTSPLRIYQRTQYSRGICAENADDAAFKIHKPLHILKYTYTTLRGCLVSPVFFISKLECYFLV